MTKIGLLGAGRIGQVHARAVSSVTNAQLVAVADPMPAAAEMLRDSYGCEVRTIEQIKDAADIDAVIIELLVHTFPETSSRSGGNSNTSLLFLFHPVHGGGTIVYFPNFVRQASVKQNTFRSGSLARVYVSNNANITVTINRRFTSHFCSLRLVLEAEVRERFVGFGHTVNVFTFLNRGTFASCSIHNLAS